MAHEEPTQVVESEAQYINFSSVKAFNDKRSVYVQLLYSEGDALSVKTWR